MADFDWAGGMAGVEAPPQEEMMNSEKTFFGKSLALDPPTGAAWRCLGCSAVLVGVLAAGLLLGGCGVKSVEELLTLAPPQGLPDTPPVDYKSVRQVMGPFHLTRIPKTWDIDEIIPRVSRPPHLQGYALYISGASPHGRMEFRVYPGQYLTLESFRDHSFYGGTPAFTPAQLRRRYPSDHATLIACSNLPPGDPAKGGKWLGPQEQEDCVLVCVARGIGFRAVPARKKLGPLDIFSGGSLLHFSLLERKIATYTAVVFPGDFPTGVYLFGSIEGGGPESEEDIWEAVHDLGVAAAYLIDGLEVITPMTQPSREEIERAAEEEIEEVLHW